jgi:hypothetical protein
MIHFKEDKGGLKRRENPINYDPNVIYGKSMIVRVAKSLTYSHD